MRDDDIDHDRGERVAIQSEGAPSTIGPKRVTAERSDIANAERLIELHGADLRYVTTWQRWIAWDGKRWADTNTAAMACAVDTARVLYAERQEGMLRAAEKYGAAAATGDLRAKDAIEAAKRALAWAEASQKEPRLVAMLNVAASFPGVAIRHDELDADPYVLNVLNGTIDLHTGSLRPHRREDLCTMIAPTGYDAHASAPTWERFVAEAMANDETMISYLRRIVGYSLTGDVREHCLGFFFGGGANGKSTFLGAIHAMLGDDYAGPAARELLFTSKGDRHPTELAALFRKRFVTCSEIRDGATMDEALVKDVTGGDLITARRMREDFWTFKPTHKLVVAGNHKPRINGTDEGIWRRMRLVPWIVTVPEERRDKSLPERLRAELAGILAWAVRGCLEWQRDGLGEPPAAAAATAEYRAESDALGRFAVARLTFEPDAVELRKVLREALEAWCLDEGIKTPSPKKLAERFRSSGVAETTKRDGANKVQNAWRGVRLKTSAELVTGSELN